MITDNVISLIRTSLGAVKSVVQNFTLIRKGSSQYSVTTGEVASETFTFDCCGFFEDTSDGTSIGGLSETGGNLWLFSDNRPRKGDQLKDINDVVHTVVNINNTDLAMFNLYGITVAL